MSNGDLALDPRRTALVLIDLQKGIAGRPAEPHASADVVARAARLIDACKAAGAYVVLVRVGFSEDAGDRLRQPVESPMPGGTLPADWSEFMPELGIGDLVITKHQWGAFYGTELDLQLRRRGVDTIILGGISTQFGVESTARDAFERGYAIVFVEDAMSSSSAAGHRHSVEAIFPRLGLIRSTEQVLTAIRQ